MGQCLSQPSHAEGHVAVVKPSAAPSASNGGVKKKKESAIQIEIVKEALPSSPGDASVEESVDKTMPETPHPEDIDGSPSESLVSIVHSMSKSLSKSSLREEPDFILTSEMDFGDIPEETDPDAPSDEEDAYQEEMCMEPGPIFITNNNNSVRRGLSPPRPQACIKARNRRTTKASSIVHHPDIAPPVAISSIDNKSKASVTPHTLAQFNKLKVQVQLAQHECQVQRRAAKFEDRYEDVQGYRKLWEEYEKLKEAIEAETNQPASDNASFDIKDSNSWYFDFQQLEEGGLETDDDSRSQASLSLLSEKSMESQRKLYAEKAKKRSSTQKSLDKLMQRIEDLNIKRQAAAEEVVVTTTNDYGVFRRSHSLDDLSASTDNTSNNNSSNNDYHVTRRRRQYTYDDEGKPILDPAYPMPDYGKQRNPPPSISVPSYSNNMELDNISQSSSQEKQTLRGRKSLSSPARKGSGSKKGSGLGNEKKKTSRKSSLRDNSPPQKSLLDAPQPKMHKSSPASISRQENKKMLLSRAKKRRTQSARLIQANPKDTPATYSRQNSSPVVANLSTDAFLAMSNVHPIDLITSWSHDDDEDSDLKLTSKRLDFRGEAKSK